MTTRVIATAHRVLGAGLVLVLIAVSSLALFGAPHFAFAEEKAGKIIEWTDYLDE